jgi:hypothetical protein
VIRKQQNPNRSGDFQMPYRTDATVTPKHIPTGLIGLLRYRQNDNVDDNVQFEAEQPDISDSTELPPGVSMANPSSLGNVNRLALLGVSIGLILLVGGIVSIGLLWPALNGPQPASDGFALLSHSGSAGNSLHNLNRLQSEIGTGGLVMGPRSTLAQGGSTGHFTDASIKRELHDPIGRSNPFDPLIHTDVPGVVSEEVEKRDVFLDLQYTGFIGDAYSKEKLAIIRLNEPTGVSKTLLKKIGDSFLVEGERATIHAISREGVRVVLSGQKRWLALQPYTETAPVTPTGQPTSPPLMNPGAVLLPGVSPPGAPAAGMVPGAGMAGGNVAPSPSNTSSSNTSSEGAVLRE